MKNAVASVLFGQNRNGESILFEKNMDFFTLHQAAQIKRVTVAVIGAGALGQMAAHQLVRTGFEKLILIDKDVLEYSNFNRQMYAVNSTVNQSKVAVLKAQVLDIDPKIDIKIHETFLDQSTGKHLVSDADIVVDCVDDIETKIYLEKLSAELNIPLVHGAVEGWYGQVTTVLPGDSVLERLYIHRKKQEVTALMITVSAVTALQVGEVIKIVTGTGELLHQRVMFIDMMSGDFSCVPIY